MKKKLLTMLLAITMCGLVLTGCEGAEKSSENDSKKSEDKDSSDDKDDKKDDEKDDKEDDADKKDDTSDEKVEEADVYIQEGETREVTINGENYVEVTFTQTENEVCYKFDGYVVSVVTDFDEIDPACYYDTDLDLVSFDILLSHVGEGGTIIKSETVAFELGKFFDEGYQLGEYDITDDHNESDLFRAGEDVSVSFGRAYYTYEGVLYVDVMVYNLGSGFGSGTIEISLAE